ncbi:hypothetical protein NADFUDRAFT_28970 [Nadsonia fulvescens var. elongata DSM 6958]|uniref:Uncharacterized protein n=1 Tax=Nadsonia fulvescens var. elongata DSM 6958 TaxID=857566 RepID=A0A1E3PD73_9ASCO|nr:hypothetical protein NADFUDRAFT_28970 [Nadsonia fulvescens var. elongata DSM 6958]
MAVPLSSVLPNSFSDMYTADIMNDKHLLLPNGRPQFTSRELIDWQLNDLRSLLIIPSMKPEWNGVIPVIVDDLAPKGSTNLKLFRILVLPLDASDQLITQTLVSSDIYLEHGFDAEFLLQTAQYTLEAARQRQYSARGMKPLSSGFLQSEKVTKIILTKPEWRNIIENYMLNLGCEAQCRMDFRLACTELRNRPVAKPIEDNNSHNTKSNSNSLLKRALLTSSSTSPDAPSANKSSLTKEEKQRIWTLVQHHLYKRIGLNWEPDSFDS